jgi:t-SNARE complex subunit (syntaxin)
MINEIKDQGKKLSTISDNVIYVKRNMESANKEVKKTEETSTKSNNLIIWVVLFISMISIVIIMIYMILYKN